MTTTSVLYARYSPRPAKALAHCESIEAQLQQCRAYCTREGWSVLAEFSDAGKSGARADNRPGLQSALDLACRKKAVLVAYSLCRIARSTVDAIQVVERLQASKANLALLTDKIDTTTPMGEFTFTIMAALGQLARKLTAQRTSDAMLSHQARGRVMGSRPPYGWRIDPASPPHHDSGKPTRLVEDPDEQGCRLRIIGLANTGVSLRHIAKWLNDERIPCRDAAGWTHQAVKAILRRAAG